MAKQVRAEELHDGRRKRQRQTQDPAPAVELQELQEDGETETQDQQSEPEQAQREEHEQEVEPQREEAENSTEPQQGQKKPTPAPTLPVHRYKSKQLARPSTQVFTLVPLDRLLPVQPVDVREFADWQTLRTYVSSYAQQTNQVSRLCVAFP